jgi:hypothetical protein
MIYPGTISIGMSGEEWGEIKRRVRSMIHFCLSYLVLLIFLGEESTKKLWDNLGILYQ